jgi:hypothetical protein
MKKLLAISIILLSITGCATPQQNAALAGLVVGAAVMGAAQSNSNHYHPPHQYHHHHYHNYQYVRPRCTYARGAFIGRNVHGAAIFEYHQICN